jgi:hypothetical protein
MKKSEFRKLIREEVRKTLKTPLLEDHFKKGDRVTPLVGPHKGVEHEVIAIVAGVDGKPENEVYNIRPLGLKPSEIKYKLGAAGATAAQLEKVNI